MFEAQRDRYAEAQKGMSKEATKACGYEVEVVVKETVEVSPPAREESEEEWLARNSLGAQQGDGSEDEALEEMLREVHSGKYDHVEGSRSTEGGETEAKSTDEEGTSAAQIGRGSEEFLAKWAESLGLSHTRPGSRS
jgi:hypothetical protein